MSSELRDGDSDSSGDESEKVTASWNDMSTSMSDAIVKFWTDHPLSQPANHDAALHPFRKLFSRFSRSAPPSNMKLSLYLIHRVMDMPRMIFYGMGIMSSKAMVQLKWFKPEVRPSTILLETCKDFFNSLKKECPLLRKCTFNSKQVANAISFLFGRQAGAARNNNKSKKGRRSWSVAKTAANAEATADQEKIAKQDGGINESLICSLINA